MKNEKYKDYKEQWGAFNSWSTLTAYNLQYRDVITTEKIYIDITADRTAGALLSQIIYWNMPSRINGKTKLRVKRDGKIWLAKARTDWWDEIRLTEYEYDHAITILKNLGLVTTKIFKFNGDPITHIHLNQEEVLKRCQRECELQWEDAIKNGEIHPGNIAYMYPDNDDLDPDGTELYPDGTELYPDNPGYNDELYPEDGSSRLKKRRKHRFLGLDEKGVLLPSAHVVGSHRNTYKTYTTTDTTLLVKPNGFTQAIGQKPIATNKLRKPITTNKQPLAQETPSHGPKKQRKLLVLEKRDIQPNEKEKPLAQGLPPSRKVQTDNTLAQEDRRALLRNAQEAIKADQKFRSSAAPRPPFKPQKRILPFLEILKNSKFMMHRDTSKAYKSLCNDLNALHTGTFFDDLPNYQHLAGRRFTAADMQRFIDNFTLAAFSPDHTPSTKGVKDTYKKYQPQNMFYNRFGSGKIKSVFAEYVDKAPKPIQIQDPFETQVNKLSRVEAYNVKLLCKKFTELFGHQFENGDRMKALECVTKTIPDFFEKNKRNFNNYNYHCRDLHKKVGLWIRMLEWNLEGVDFIPNPGVLTSQRTLKKATEFFREDGIYIG